MAIQFPPPRQRTFRGPSPLLVIVIWSWLGVIGLLYIVTKILNLIGVL